MAGKIKQMIDTLIIKRAKKNAALEEIIKTKLMLKTDHRNFTAQSPDNQAEVDKLEILLKEL